jgi:hypothetical protein
MKIKSSPTSEIKDYLIEEWIRCPYKYVQKNVLGISADDLNWRQMVQYSVNHVINDLYMLPKTERSEAKILELIHHRWTNKVRSFHSQAHFQEVRSQVTGNLTYYFLKQQPAHPPMILFEKYSVWIKALNAHLSMIFQHVQVSEQSYILKKYLIDEDPDVIAAYKHMAVVFCNQAFSDLPEKIEIYLLLSGNKIVFEPSKLDINPSLDYLYLTHDLIDGAMPYAKQDSLTECRTCPFRYQCHKESSQPSILKQ